MFRVLAVVALVACKDDAQDVNMIHIDREHHSRITIAGVAFATVFERGADEKSPLLVMLHGRGETPERFRDAWHNFPVKLELDLPQAPLLFEHGRQWFDPGTSDASTAAAALWPAMVELAHGRKLLVGGIGQGAAVASAMAAQHPDAITCVLPIDGNEVTPETYAAIVAQVRGCL